MRTTRLHAAVLGWYDEHRRDLPWRQPQTSAWAVLVSEVMLQQTPVARVEPAYREWMARWPTPRSLAEAPVGEAIRQWGRLGYPRRALRLHQAAVAICARHGGRVPSSYGDLHALPGVGDYTAAAVSVFAYRRRQPVLDTNVRRVLGRLLRAEAFPGTAVTTAERSAAEALLPVEAEQAARWSVGVMELGALVCTARRPACESCPLAGHCAWRSAGQPGRTNSAARRQPYTGTDRQCRGVILAELRALPSGTTITEVASDWPDKSQRARALTSLVADGLVIRSGDALALP